MNVEPNRTAGPRRWAHFLLLLSTSLTPGCLGGLKVAEVATSVDKPSNVAVYVSVVKGDRPVTGLSVKSFVISEDGQVIPAEQTQQVLLSQDVAAVHRAMLLVDMSGAITEGDTRTRIEQAAALFVTRARVTQPVTVFAFDGGAALTFVGDYPQGDEAVTELPVLSGYQPKDTSSNLNSAVIEALAQLDARLMSAQKPLRIGSLVVFARGPDLAGRVTEAKLSEVLGDTKHQIFAIALAETPGLRPDRIGDDGVFTSPGEAQLGAAFEKAGTRVADVVAQHYLLSYCSPARAGKRWLKVEVVTKDEKGAEERGSLTTQLDATGFHSGCDPNATPRFVVRVELDESRSDPQKTEEKKGPPHAAPAPGRPGGSPPANDADQEGDEVVPPPAKPGYAQ